MHYEMEQIKLGDHGRLRIRQTGVSVGITVKLISLRLLASSPSFPYDRLPLQ